MQKKVNDNYKTKSIAHSTKSSKYAIKGSKTASKLRTTLVSVLLFFSILLFATLFIYTPLNEQNSGVNQVAALSETGTCGDGVKYAFDSSSGTLTISRSGSGTGAMTNYDSISSPFYKQTSIKTVIIESGVTSIGNYAFYNCSGLTSVTIGSDVTSIGESAFQLCKGLTSVTIGSGVTTIGYFAFYYCSGLTKVNYTGTIAKWCGIKFSVEANPLSYAKKLYINNTEVKELTIPDSVTSIGAYAFEECSGLTSVILGNGVKSIGDRAFYNCKGLTSITIPDSLTSIGSSAFSGCSGLTNITIPDSLTSIGSSAFSGCSGLTNITIPNSVTSIGNYAFYNCSGLTSTIVASENTAYTSRGRDGDECNAIIEKSSNTLILGCNNTIIPDGVTSIGNYAFYNCKGLTSITIPDSVTSIGSAFYNCKGLTSVTIGAGVTSIGVYAFYSCSSLTKVNYTGTIEQWCGITFGTDIDGTYSNPLYYGRHLYISNAEVTDLVIPNTVTTIKDFAFYFCEGLTSITIPDSVTSIGDYVFYNCNNLTIIGSGNTSAKAYTYAKSKGINYATAWEITDTTHTRTFYGFKDDSNATGVTQTESHSWENGVCSVCGEIHESTITLSVETNVNRSFIVYVLDSAGQPTRQFVVTNGTTISFQVKETDVFTVQVYETLYSVIKIDGDNRLKKTYSNLSSDTTIDISISGVTGIYNWVMI